MKKGFYIVILALLLIALSFFRETIFLNINGHMWYLYYHNDRSYLAPFLSFLNPLSYNQLYWFKWFLTIFFSLIFLLSYCSIIMVIFREKRFIRWTVLAFISIILVSGLSYICGKLFNDLVAGYTISRFFMGMIQSPFLLIFLIPAFRLAIPQKKS